MLSLRKPIIRDYLPVIDDVLARERSYESSLIFGGHLLWGGPGGTHRNVALERRLQGYIPMSSPGSSRRGAPGVSQSFSKMGDDSYSGAWAAVFDAPGFHFKARQAAEVDAF